MALTDDQKAMLRLLAQREEGYEDMAALMGISIEQVRERVKEALTEVDAPKAAAETTPEPPAPPPASPVEAPPPSPPPPTPTQAAPTRKGPTRFSGLKMPKDRGALIGLGAGALVVVILAIVLIVGGGEGDSGSSATTAEGGQGSNTAAADSGNLTQATLASVDGGDASGQALFGRFKKNILLQVEADGLDASPQGSSYAVWLSRSSRPVVPVGTGKVDDSGRLIARFPVPEEVLVLVARKALDTIDVTLVSDSKLAAALAKARRAGQVPTYTGTKALTGTIEGPLVGAAAKGSG